MYAQEIIFSRNASRRLKEAVLQIIIDENIIDQYTKVIRPTSSNDDVNGSQHVSNGGTDFTYEDVEDYDLDDAETLGYYEYFSTIYQGSYTGHYYQGSSEKFSAIVINPPAYAVSMRI